MNQTFRSKFPIWKYFPISWKTKMWLRQVIYTSMKKAHVVRGTICSRKVFNNYGEENRYKRYVFVVLSPCYGKIEACYILENSVAKIKTKRTNICLRNVSYWFLKNSLSTLNIDKIWICLSCKNNGTSNYLKLWISF